MFRKTLYTILLLMMCGFASAQSYSVIVTNPQLSAMFHIINDLDYEHFLTDGCKDFKTIMIVPTNEGIAEYIDPLSYGNEMLNMWNITYGDVGNTKGFFCGIYNCEFNESMHSWEKGDSLTMIKGTTVLSQSSFLGNRLKDLLENSIIMGEYKEGKLYYKTIGNMIVRIDGIEKGSTIYGPLQMEYNTPLTVVESIVEDGRLVLVVDGPIMGSRKSVYKLLSEKPEFSKFSDIIAECLLYNTGRDRDYAVGGANLFYKLSLFSEWSRPDRPEFEKYRYLLNDFHYTIYAPTNAAMDEAFAKGLPTLDDLAAAYEYDEVHGPDSAAKIIEIMRNFVVYHIQDHSIFIDKGAKGGKYTTAKNVFKLNSYTDSDGNVSTEYKAIMPYKVNVDVTESSLKVTDALGNTHNVLTNSGLYNLVANEYWADNINVYLRPFSTKLLNSSTVVIHAIDGPLMYSNKQFVNEYWDNNYIYYK